ncbi:MAG: hypothetical protein PVF82_09985 [Gammaproteobacteria bacterium]|jgi:hypothetical protein
MVEVTGGSYVEEASGVEVSLADGQKLRSLVHYENGHLVSTNVTPLTHMASALTEYKIANQMAPMQAMEEAFAKIREVFTLDSRGVTSINITTENSTDVTEINDDVLYGFYMAGLSSWTARASQLNMRDPHTTYTSVGLAQIMYDDIRADGLLNGLGMSGSDLAFGNITLNADEYRLAFSAHMLAMANNAQLNKTALNKDDLKPAADAIAQQTEFVGATQALDISTLEMKIALAEPVNGYYSGNFGFNLDVTGVLGIDQLSVLVDGAPATLVGDPLVPPITIDTTEYIDGAHTVTVQAFNALGFEADPEVFQLNLDNTGPEVIVTSSELANDSMTQIGGTYTDNLAGVASITVEGVDIDFADGNWNTDVTVASGENTITIVVTDSAGNQKTITTRVFLDNIRPDLLSGPHAKVLLSTGDAPLPMGQLGDGDVNNIPIYLETDYEGFKVPFGQAISRSALVDSGIPYFAFTVSDSRDVGVNAMAKDLAVRMQYEREGIVLNEWHGLPVPEECQLPGATSCEYLIPLISEMLDPEQIITSSWDQTSPSDQHVIRIEVADLAGNINSIEYSFKVDFFVSQFCADNTQCQPDEISVSDIGSEIFAQYNNADFQGRSDLMSGNFEFGSTVYAFSNPTMRPIYINLYDDSAHSASQYVDTLVRQHEAILVTTTWWRLGVMDPLPNNPLSDPCPSPDANVLNWVETAAVWNWNGTDWILESSEVEGAPAFVSSDNPPAPTIWRNAEDFDTELASETINRGGIRIVYDYDYIPELDINPAWIGSWNVQSQNNIIRECSPQRAIEQHEVFTYKSISGPENVASSDTITANFATNNNNFIVTSGTSATPIEPVNGWYLIAPGAEVTIEKSVILPQLIPNQDTFPIPPEPAPYDNPLRNDQSITWSVNRHLSITAIHDGGQDNIGTMSTREMVTNTGLMDYTISRQ